MWRRPHDDRSNSLLGDSNGGNLETNMDMVRPSAISVSQQDEINLQIFGHFQLLEASIASRPPVPFSGCRLHMGTAWTRWCRHNTLGHFNRFFALKLMPPPIVEFACRIECSFGQYKLHSPWANPATTCVSAAFCLHRLTNWAKAIAVPRTLKLPHLTRRDTMSYHNITPSTQISIE